MTVLKVEEKGLKSIQRGLELFPDQMAFTQQNQINDLLFGAKRFVQKQADVHLDNPKPWTKTGVQIVKAKKSRLAGEIFVAENRLHYLGRLQRGGVASAASDFPGDRETLSIPNLTAIESKYLTKSNSLRKNAIAAMLKRTEKGGKRGAKKTKLFFIGTRDGVSGLWRRPRNGKIRLIVLFQPSAKWKQHTFPFYRASFRYINKNASAFFIKAHNRAINTSFR